MTINDHAAAGRTGSTWMSRSTLILVVGVSLLVLTGIVVILALGKGRETKYPAHSPQHAVATFLRLLENGNVDEAYKLTAMADPQDSTLAMTREHFHQQFDDWSRQSHRVTLMRTHATGAIASVTVEITAFSAGQFGASDSTNDVTFTLTRHGTDRPAGFKLWRITGPTYLYP